NYLLTKKGKPNKKAILHAIDNILKSHQKMYTTIDINLNIIEFSTKAAFTRSLLLVVAQMHFTKNEKP
ncbi:MAG TPA: hypothetical protein PKD85_23355, partial [Saprospiraceae bacterium]|nr:hypothetical protein [Saprospiraceae bacterium]